MKDQDHISIVSVSDMDRDSNVTESYQNNNKTKKS